MQLDGENPWPGLESFEENSSAFFYGRDREAESLLSHVLDAPVIVLYGRSGLGKTSLLQAGLFPELRERQFLPIYVRFELEPDAPPLSRQLHRSVQESIRAEEVPDAKLPLDEESPWEYLHRDDFALYSARNYPLTPVIVLDQFEELFTRGGRFPDLVGQFRNDLGDLAENRIPADLVERIEDDEAVAERFRLRSRNYKLLISLREDFLPDLEGWRQVIPALGRTRFRLLPMRPDEAFDAVHKPGKHMMMTDALANQVVDIVAGKGLHPGRDTDVDRPSDDFGASDVEPALLSLFCRELNEERKRRGQPQFDEQLVEDRRDILSNYYESCVRDLPPRVAQFIESQLITENGYRNSYAREDAVGSSRLTEDELARLIGSRLLRVEERLGREHIELAHDVLAPVVREQRDQRRAEEKRAAQAARAEQERQAELQDAKLRVAQERERAARERQETVEAHAADLRRRSRILRRVWVGTAIIAVIAVVFAVLTWFSQQQAQTNQRAATVQKLIAQAQGMLAGAVPGGDAQAFQQILAAHALTKDNTADGALYTAVAQRASTLKIITGPTGAVNGVAFSPDGHRLASASADGSVRLWGNDSGQPIGAPLAGPTGAVNGVAFSPDGHRLATANNDKTVRLWDADSGQQIRTLAGDTGAVLGVAFSSDGHRLASASADGSVRLWDADSGQQIRSLTGHTGAVFGVAFSPDGHRLASANTDKTVRLWDADSGQQIRTLTGHTGAVTRVAFSPDGHRLASASNDGSVRLWDADSGQQIGAPLTGHTGPVLGVAFSPDGHRLASASNDQTVRQWDADSGQQLGTPLTGHTGAVNGVAFSPDGHRLASASNDQTVRLWDGMEPLTGHTRPVTGVAFSPDGHRLASASLDQTVRLWDPDTGQQIRTLTGDSPMNGVAFSPNGHRLATANDDQTVRLWDADSGQQIRTLTGHTGRVLGVAFSPDGQHLASASADKTVRLWDADTGQQIGVPLTGHTDAVFGVAFSPDGQRLASASADTTVRLWPADASPEMLCAKLTANISHQQWGQWVRGDIEYQELCPGLPIPADA